MNSTFRFRADNDVLKALLPKLTTGGAAVTGFFTAMLLALPASAALLVGLASARAIPGQRSP